MAEPRKTIDEVLNELEAELNTNDTVDGSAEALMERLFAEFEANKNAPARIQELVDKGRAANAKLAAAVLAFTPQAEDPPVEPPVEGRKG